MSTLDSQPSQLAERMREHYWSIGRHLGRVPVVSATELALRVLWYEHLPPVPPESAQ